MLDVLESISDALGSIENNEIRNKQWVCLLESICSTIGSQQYDNQSFFRYNKDFLRVDEPILGCLSLSWFFKDKKYTCSLRPGYGGDTLLHLLAQCDGMNGVIDTIIGFFEANPNVENNVGFTPLVVALIAGIPENFKVLLNGGADLQKKFRYLDMEFDVMGLSLYFGRIQYIKLILDVKRPNYAIIMYMLHSSIQIYLSVNQIPDDQLSSSAKHIRMDICKMIISYFSTKNPIRTPEVIREMLSGVPKEIFKMILEKSDFLYYRDCETNNLIQVIKNSISKLSFKGALEYTSQIFECCNQKGDDLAVQFLMSGKALASHFIDLLGVFEQMCMLDGLGHEKCNEDEIKRMKKHILSLADKHIVSFANNSYGLQHSTSQPCKSSALTSVYRNFSEFVPISVYQVANPVPELN